MKHFLYSISLFIIFLFLLTIILTKDYQFLGTSNYMDAIIDKHNLLEKTDSPRILFCGGSNLAFGIDSKRIQDSIGLPVINMSLHAGVGLDFIINETKFVARPSDIVIFSVEYFLSTDGNYRLKKLTAKNFPLANSFFKTNYFSDVKYFLKEGMRNNFENNLKHLFVKSDGPSDSTYLYSRNSFNYYGDVVRHLTLKPPKDLIDRGELIYEHWKGISTLNDFAKYAKSNNITVFFIYPNYPETEYILNREVISNFASDLETELNIQILNKPSDFIFADSLFYDTTYHLNKFGREKRTNLLIELIKGHIKR